MANERSEDNVWEYDPNMGAAIFFMILWLLITVYHILQMLQYQKWYCWTLVMGCSWELTGFILRIISIKFQEEVKYYAPMLTFIILAPIWIAAFAYMSLGRLILVFLPQKRCLGLSARRITLLFVLGDILSFVVQVAGTNFLTSDTATEEEIHIGTSILIAGQALQLFLFAIFIVLGVRFEINYRDLDHAGAGKECWRPFMRALNLCCGCIFLRSIFRIAEFASEYPGPLVRHEAPFYLLDALPMALAVAAFHFWHPGQTLLGEESSFRAEKRRRKAEQQRDEEGMVMEMDRRM